MNSFRHNVAIFSALMMRDIKVLKSNLGDLFIDGLILLCINVLIFGNLLPMLGMSTTLIAPIFLGNSLSFFLASLGHSFATRMSYDLSFERFINYFLTLPLPKRWLFGYFITSFILETSIVTLPMITLGIIMLGENFGTINSNFIPFLVIYFLFLLFWALFFLGSSFLYDFQWFKSNMWARRIMPLFVLGPAFFTFATIRSVMPTASFILWFNPLTYFIEGMRSTLLGGSDYLPVSICLLGIVPSLLLMTIRLYRGIHKQLDPV
jgi:hypothetical protein